MKRIALSKARKKNGYSQSTFAKKLNVSTEHVRSLEYGRVNPSTYLMFNICKVLESTPEILFKDLMK